MATTHAPARDKASHQSSEKNESLSQFCALFLELAVARRSGTLRVLVQNGWVDDDGNSRNQEAAFLFRDGCIADLDVGRDDTILARAIIATDAVSDRELRKCRKKVSKKGGPTLGLMLFELGRVSDEEVLERVQETLIEESCAIFAAGPNSFKFTEHPNDEIVEGFNNELSELFDLLFAGEDIFIEAMRRLNRWDLVQKNYGGILDIYYATPSGMKFYNEPDRYVDEIAVIKRMDGMMDLGEVIAAVELSPFDAFLVIQALIYQNEIERLNPIQMFQLGVDCSDKGNWEKARKIFQRAMDLGLDDFDIQFKLARTYEALGKSAEAKRRYREFADKCMDQSRRKDAIRSYRRIVEIDPLDAETQKTIVRLLVAEGRQEEALVQGLTAAESFAAARSPRAALDHLLFLRELELQESQLSAKIIEFANQCGEKEIADKEIAKNPTRLDELVDVDRALEMCQRQFCEGNGSLEIRLKLVELHMQRGHRDEVLKHINAILGSKLEKMIHEKKILEWLHKTRCSLQPGNLVSNKWMIDYYRECGKTEKAIAILEKLLSHMEGERENFYLIDLRKYLVSLEPEKYEPRWELVQLCVRLEKHKEALAELEAIAKLAASKKDLATARKAWSEAVRHAPFRRESLERFSQLLIEFGERDDAVEKLKALLRMDLAGQNLTGAREVFNRIEALSPKDPVVAECFGRALLTAPDEKQNALEHLVNAAAAYLERKDLGSARRVLEVVLQKNSAHPEAIARKKRLEELEAALERPQAPPPAARPAAQPAPVHHAPVQTVTPGPTVMMPSNTPGDPHGQKEAFQPRAPIRKTTVSAITARLRGLKGGDDAKGSFGGKQIVQSGLKSITDSLKKQRSSGDDAAPADPAAASGGGDASGGDDEPPPRPKHAPVSTRKGVNSVASKLKALAAGGGGAAPAPAPAPGDASDASESAPAPAASDASDASGDTGGGGESRPSSGASALGGALVEEQMKRVQKAASSGAVVKKSLGGSASKLAALRTSK